jgi:hypothetical protein
MLCYDLGKAGCITMKIIIYDNEIWKEGLEESKVRAVPPAALSSGQK